MGLKLPQLDRVDGKTWRLREDFISEYESREGGKYRITVKRGFTYDKASIPDWKPFRWGIRQAFGLFKNMEEIQEAALVHDWIYYHSRISDAVLPYGSHEYLDELEQEYFTVYGSWSRKAADRLFFRLCRRNGVDRSKVAWLGVRLGGWTGWGS